MNLLIFRIDLGARRVSGRSRDELDERVSFRRDKEDDPRHSATMSIWYQKKVPPMLYHEHEGFKFGY